MRREGGREQHDPEGEGIAAVADPHQVNRLACLRSVLQTALADLP